MEKTKQKNGQKKLTTRMQKEFQKHDRTTTTKKIQENMNENHNKMKRKKKKEKKKKKKMMMNNKKKLRKKMKMSIYNNQITNLMKRKGIKQERRMTTKLKETIAKGVLPDQREIDEEEVSPIVNEV